LEISESYLYFPGCTIPCRENNYEVSARAVARVLGIDLQILEGYSCCGASIEAVDKLASFLLGARNLALTEEQRQKEIFKEGKALSTVNFTDFDTCLVTLCNGCYRELSIVNGILKSDFEMLKKVNSALSKIGKKYRGTVVIKHFLEVLLSEKYAEKLRSKIVRRFEGLKVATQVGCHATSPREFVNFDDYEVPKRLDGVLEMTGAEAVDYLDRNKCCGAPLLTVSEKTALALARYKLFNMKDAGAQLVVTMCPFCQIMLDAMQERIEEEFGGKYELPVLYITQFLGLSFGLDPGELDMKNNKVPWEEVLAPFL
jgi:heterodisulfide reductase subunit B